MCSKSPYWLQDPSVGAMSSDPSSCLFGVPASSHVGPQPSLLFSSGTLPHFADHISVNVELRFGAVVIASTSLSFYDCVAVTASSPSAP